MTIRPPSAASEGVAVSTLVKQLVRSVVGPSISPARNSGVPVPGTGEIVVTYVGHATTLVQMDGITVLTDPVYSDRLMVPKRLVEPGIAIEDLPPLDLVLVSHGHFDHLDVPTHQRLPSRATAVVAKNLSDLIAPCGYERVIELAWGETFRHRDLTVTALPVRHWGTRNVLPDNRGYTGFLLRGPSGSVFFPGDTAYFPGFAEYGAQFDIDVALLPIGAYRPDSFRRVPMNPEDAFQAFRDLRARHMVPIHWGTFVISLEPIDEPINWLAEIAAREGALDGVVILRHGESRRFPRPA